MCRVSHRCLQGTDVPLAVESPSGQLMDDAIQALGHRFTELGQHATGEEELRGDMPRFPAVPIGGQSTTHPRVVRCSHQWMGQVSRQELGSWLLFVRAMMSAVAELEVGAAVP